jgi:predicted lipoprotein with Yx(FWY)xxD motif
MTMNLKAFVLVAVALALLVAGCGGSDSSSSGGGAYGGGGSTATTRSAETTPTEGAATVMAKSVPKLGKVIVDSDGFTLYDFHKDKGTTSSCYGACAGVWPPLMTGSAPKAAGGASASKLGTTKRKDGTTQVTFAGHPLYTYTADTKPGDAKGNDITTYGGQWYALEPNGEEAGD